MKGYIDCSNITIERLAKCYKLLHLSKSYVDWQLPYIFFFNAKIKDSSKLYNYPEIHIIH